jgi:hypothetical protein
MAEFVFTSPGVKFKERDITFVTKNVGVTTLGVVGETLKGPAFEPIFIADATNFSTIFGAQSTKRFPNNNQLQYQLPYVANAYLQESNQLWVTRVLGLSGYDAGTGWALRLESGVDPETVGISGASVNGTFTATNNIYLGVSLYKVNDTGVSFSGFTKDVNTNLFSGKSIQFTATTVSNGNVTGDTKITTFTGTSYSEYEDMVLAVIRSRGIVVDHINAPATTDFQTNLLLLPSSGNTTLLTTGNIFADFKLIASNTGNTSIFSGSSKQYIASLDPNASSFLPNVIGFEPKDKNTMIWVEQVFPDLLNYMGFAGSLYPTGLTSYGMVGIAPYAYGISSSMIKLKGGYADYNTGFKTPETPWVVSQLRGNSLSNLFRFILISDGDSANQQVKIGISNINPVTLEFDVVIRDFWDTDAAPVVLESFPRCSMLRGTNSYIGAKIGTIDGTYDLQSTYVMIEIAEDAPIDAFPAGFQGYVFNNYATSATTDTIVGIQPKIIYKTEYSLNERPAKFWLGTSNTAYNSTGINQNFFNFNGIDGSGIFEYTKGFHMDSGATGIYDGMQYDTGAAEFRGANDALNPLNPYFNIVTRKFLVVPQRGFDGWNVNRGSRSTGDLYAENAIYDGVDPNTPAYNDYQAWTLGINTYNNPDQVTINLFSTPGINWSDQNSLVINTIEMIELQRSDTLYVIDTPQFSIDTYNGQEKPADVLAAEAIVDALNTAEIDSSYSCTYFPWIQLRDTQNNVNLYLPPTGEVVKAMAFTDNSTFPWFAPAGLQRGVTDARKSQFKLSQAARDILYAGRINPLADFPDSGTAIFGQKTLQVKQSALDRINVRRLLLQVKVLISNIAIRLVFEQNDQATIDQFIGKATPVLDTIKRERGLTDFRIKMDSSNNTPETIDRNELFGEIFLKPTRSVEFIGITFTITPTGASFNDVGV